MWTCAHTGNSLLCKLIRPYHFKYESFSLITYTQRIYIVRTFAICYHTNDTIFIKTRYLVHLFSLGTCGWYYPTLSTHEKPINLRPSSLSWIYIKRKYIIHICINTCSRFRDPRKRINSSMTFYRLACKSVTERCALRYSPMAAPYAHGILWAKTCTRIGAHKSLPKNERGVGSINKTLDYIYCYAVQMFYRYWRSTIH